MDYNVYILRSLKNKRHYTGITTDLERRLNEHNNGDTKSTRAHTPYERIWASENMSKSDALKLEIKIKKKGATKYLEEIL
jgi:putative endonuclease